MTNLASVINFCTYDLRFLHKCIQGVRPFSSQIVIAVCDHLFNGEKEDPTLLQQIYETYPDVDFVEFAYSEDEVYGTPSKLVPNSPGWSTHWHNSARLIATYFLRPDIETVLFLDVDEIFSSPIPEIDLDVVRFATYWYFRTSNNCATVYPNGPLLIRRGLLNTEILLNEDERMGMYELVDGSKAQNYLVGKRPIVHHYSWVRPNQEIKKKISAWGHHWERDWKKLLEQESDFVRRYSYEKVKSYWDPLKEEICLQPKGKRDIPKVTPKEIFRMEIIQIIQQ